MNLPSPPQGALVPQAEQEATLDEAITHLEKRSAIHRQNSEHVALIWLRLLYGFGIIALAAYQLYMLDHAMYLAADINTHFRLDPITFRTFAIGTFIEILGVVYIIVRHLFPTEAKPLESLADMLKTFKDRSL